MTTPKQSFHFWSLAKREWRTVPNLITLVRLVLVGVIVWLLIEPHVSWQLPFGLFIIVAASDWVDGYIAKRYSQVTQLGKIIDPLVDKLLIVGVLVTLAARSGHHSPESLGVVISLCLGLLVIREVGVLQIKRRMALASQKVDSAIQSGRISMATQCVSVALLLTPVSAVLKIAILFVALLASYYSWWDYEKRS